MVMEITLTISEEAAQIIEREAKENDKRLSEFAAELLEDKVKEKFPDHEVEDGPHPLFKMAGMFSSSKTDTSTRYKEILLDEIKMPGGFGGDR
jgi:hypothetical protein